MMPSVRGGFLNVSIQNDAVDLTQAVLEGVAFGLRDSLEALRQTGALPRSTLRDRRRCKIRLLAEVIGNSSANRIAGPRGWGFWTRAWRRAPCTNRKLRFGS